MIRIIAACFGLFAGALQAQPLAWRATLPGADGELLLLGSIHVLRQQDYPLPSLVDALYDQADAVLMELELDEIDPLTMQAQLVSAALIGNRERLGDLLEPRLYALVDTEASRLGIELSMLDQFEPWFVALTLSSIGIAKLGYQPEMGLEQHLLAQARRDHKDILGLETLADQVAVFDTLSEPEQAALLEQTVQELHTTDLAMTSLIEAWRRGELQDLVSQLAEDFEDFPELYDELVLKRNAAWSDRLASLIRDGRTFLVVVGALHLVGEGNVLERLEDRGFEITLLH